MLEMPNTIMGVEVIVVRDGSKLVLTKRPKKKKNRRWVKRYWQRYSKWVRDPIIPDGKILTSKDMFGPIYVNPITFAALRNKMEDMR